MNLFYICSSSVVLVLVPVWLLGVQQRYQILKFNSESFGLLPELRAGSRNSVTVYYRCVSGGNGICLTSGDAVCPCRATVIKVGGIRSSNMSASCLRNCSDDRFCLKKKEAI